MTAFGLGVVGAVVSACVNPIALAVSGLGVTLHALTMKKNYSTKVEACRFAYTSYQKELNTLRGAVEEKSFTRIFISLNSTDWMTSSPICVLPFRIN